MVETTHKSCSWWLRQVAWRNYQNDNVNNMNAHTVETNKIIVWRVTEGLELEADNLMWETQASAVCK